MKVPIPYCFRCGLALLLLGVFVAALDGATPPDLWFRRPTPGLTADLHSVAYGNGVFVAVGQDSTVARSTDSLAWTTGSAGAFGTLRKVRFLNHQFIAWGEGNQLLFSGDGSVWTPRTIPAQSARDIAYGNGVYVLATDVDPLYSTDGTTWLPIATREPNSLPWETPPSALLQVVTFANGQFVGMREMIALHQTPYSVAITSPNGLDWTISGYQTSDLPLDGSGIDFGLGRYTLVQGGVLGLASSTDGTHWSCPDCSPIFGFGAYDVGQASSDSTMMHVRAQFTFFGQGLSIQASSDGVTWTPSLQFPQPGEDPQSAYYGPLLGYPRAVAYGGGAFVVVGAGGYIIQSSAGGGKPSILSQPQSATASVGDSVTFKVIGSGASPLAYQWYHGADPVSGANADTLTISSVKTTDAGTYEVVVSNGSGSITSNPARLDVAFASVRMYAGVRIDGVVGKSYRIEATPEVGPPNWTVVGQVVLSTTPQVWYDADTPENPKRLYRVTELP